MRVALKGKQLCLSSSREPREAPVELLGVPDPEAGLEGAAADAPCQDLTD